MLQKNWQDLIKPEKLVTEAGVDARRTAPIVAEPLERGFGLTLGNALRRVLLSSLQGAAVTSIKIDNVLHEFSSIPGVREDVVDIVLNIKAMAVKMQGDRPQRLYLRAVGPGEVTAGMIELPVRIMRAVPTPRGIIKIVMEMVRAIWCAARGTAPNQPIMMAPRLNAMTSLSI